MKLGRVLFGVCLLLFVLSPCAQAGELPFSLSLSFIFFSCTFTKTVAVIFLYIFEFCYEFCSIFVLNFVIVCSGDGDCAAICPPSGGCTCQLPTGTCVSMFGRGGRRGGGRREGKEREKRGRREGEEREKRGRREGEEEEKKGKEKEN